MKLSSALQLRVWMYGITESRDVEYVNRTLKTIESREVLSLFLALTFMCILTRSPGFQKPQLTKKLP